MTRRTKSEVDRRKMSVYMPVELRAQIDAEAERLDRKPSWLLQTAWRLALRKIQSLAGSERRS